jgi:putative nucleotidyltransferase with HDIG domain
VGLKSRKVSLSLLSGVVFSILLIAGFYFGFSSREPFPDTNYTTGMPVPEGIVAVHDFSVPYSSEELEQMAAEVEASVPVYLVRNLQIGLDSSEQIEELIASETENSELARYFGQRISSLYSTGIIDIDALRMVYSGERAVVDDGSVEYISELFTLAEARDGIGLDLERRGVLRDKLPIILGLIVPDLEMDSSSTEAAVLRAVAGISKTKREFHTGEQILLPGGLFTEEISRYWDAMVLSPGDNSGLLKHNTAKTALAALLLFLGFVFMWRQQYSLFVSVSDLSLLFAIWGLTIGMTILLFRSGVAELSVFSFTMLGASLTSVFFDSRLRNRTINNAWFLAAVYAGVFALVSPRPMATFFMAFVPSCLVSAAIKDINERATTVAMLLGIVSSVAVYWLLTVTGSVGSMRFGSVVWIALIGFPVAIIGTVKVISHPFELLFRVATARTYERLGNDNHPLRVLLSKKAKGTYEHSRLVGDLAAAAAVELGADENLARLGGFFHDIGKLNNPEMFIENIVNPEENNPHLLMSPEESARIIIGHVYSGVELAGKHHLPADIRDIIMQHHGDSSTRYFLEKARRELPPGGELDEAVFHYKGPKPQSVEAALVMLADAVSSAVRGLGKTVTDEETAETISRIIREKTEEGQFDQCRLSVSMKTRAAHVFMDELIRKDYKRVKHFPHGK